VTASNPADHTSEAPTQPVDAVLDPDALHAELDRLALARAQAWYDRQAARQATRQAHQAARQHGLRQRHARKLARKEQS